MREPAPAAGEEALIQGYLARLAADAPGALGLKDDCALLVPEPGHDLVLTTDAVAAGVHFFADDAAADIGWKALAVNVSDLAAKGATPVAYLMALALPEAPRAVWMEGLVAGLAEAQAAFGCRLIGGDTDRRPGPLSITITAIGQVPSGRMVRRGGAKPGDRIYVSGTLGDAALGLRLRTDRGTGHAWRLDAAGAEYLAGRYLRPRPVLALGQALQGSAAAAMDISDGFAKDLGRMAAASGTGAVVRAAAVPLSAPARAALVVAPELLADVLSGGDDYEILAAVPPGSAAAFEAESRRSGVSVTHVGEMTADGGIEVHDAAGREIALNRSGYDHF